MRFSVEKIGKELKELFAVAPDDPRWSRTELVDLPVVRQLGARLGLPPSHSNIALATALLRLTADRLTPSGPEAPVDEWKLVVGPELNFLARLRAYVAGALLDRAADASGLPRACLEEAARASTYSPDEFASLAPAQRDLAVQRATGVVWAWKTRDSLPLDQAGPAWPPLLKALAREGVFTRDIIYECRRRFRHRLAEVLYATQQQTVDDETGVPLAGLARPPLADAAQRERSAATPPMAAAAVVWVPPGEPSGIPAATPPRDDWPATAPEQPGDVAPWIAWLNARLDAAATTQNSLLLGVQARRLAQNLATIELGICPAETTRRLVRENVRLALRRSGINDEASNEGDEPLELLLRAAVLRQGDGRLEFVHPNACILAAAEYVCEYDSHWVSLHPRYRRVMRWAAAILARRRDERRTGRFCDDLRQAASLMSPVAWLAIADWLAEFGQDRSPAVAALTAECLAILQPLAHSDFGRLRRACQAALERLGGAPSVVSPSGLIEAALSAEAFGAARAGIDLDTLTGRPGPRRAAHRGERLQSGRVIGALIQGLISAESPMTKLQCAAWLYAADLSVPVAVDLSFPTVLVNPLRSAWAEIARLATSRDHDELTRTLALSLLAQDTAVLALWDLPGDDLALPCELELTLGKRVRFNRFTRQMAFLPDE